MSTQSQNLIKRAEKHIPGGVNSPVRAFNAVGGVPRFIEKGEGPYIYDADGKQYIDYVGSWGPLILGHAHPDVIAAVQKTAEKGLGFGAPTALEVEIADLLCDLLPSMDMVRLVNSGTEATMTALRLARGYTGRNKIIKFEGCYHGHSDSLLVQAGSGLLTFGVPTSPGVPEDLVKHTLVATFNDLDSVTKLFEEHGNDIAAIIIEPFAGNMNFIPPAKGFLEGLRELCDAHKSVYILDEVMTGFRVGLKGAQGLLNITPDLTTLGKVIGGGMPIAAFGGKREIMEFLSPAGPVYQAGTLSGNPVSVAAGLATLKAIQTPGFYEDLSAKTKLLMEGLRERAHAAGIPFTVNYQGSMFGFFFSDEETITGFKQVKNCNGEHFKQFFHSMLDAGHYFAASSYEAGFMSAAHTEAIIQTTLDAAATSFTSLSHTNV